MNLTHRLPHRITSAVLADRLRAGKRRIEAETDLNKRAELENYWLELLRRYEMAYDAEQAYVQEVLA